MKRKIIAVLLLLLILTGCSHEGTKKVKNASKNSNEESINIEDDVVDVYVGDAMFITTLNDIYTNFDNYKGKSIDIEGFALKYEDQRFVGRYGPGCCSNDVIAFFPIRYNGDIEIEYAEDWVNTGVVNTSSSWIKITGILEEDTLDGEPYYYVNVTDIIVKDSWGKEQVYQ